MSENPSHGRDVDPDGGTPQGPRGEIPSAPGDLDDLDLDLDLLPAAATRPVNRLTAVLAVGILAVATFAAGALVQRAYGQAGSSGGPAGARSLAGSGGLAGPGSFGSGAFGGAGTLGRSGTSGGSGSSGGSGTSGAPPVAVGTVVSVSGRTIVLRNFGGTKVEVTVPKGTRVTVTTTRSLSDLLTGQVVSITGTKGDDGRVTATSVTAAGAAATTGTQELHGGQP